MQRATRDSEWLKRFCKRCCFEEHIFYEWFLQWSWEEKLQFLGGNSCCVFPPAMTAFVWTALAGVSAELQRGQNVSEQSWEIYALRRGQEAVS